MDIIPVIDVKNGLVVHARRGERGTYQPIATPLSATAEPDDVLAGLLTLYPFRHAYIADLDAIAGTGDNSSLTADLARQYPGIEFWVDRGTADVQEAKTWLAREPGILVLGSESQRDGRHIAMLRHEPRIALSLDFRGDEFIGPAELLAAPDLWPSRVIVMTLARVGSGMGPDLERLARIKAAAGKRKIIAAGGVRDAADLATLAKAGISGALVATALHDGRLTTADLRRLADSAGRNAATESRSAPPSSPEPLPGGSRHNR